MLLRQRGSFQGVGELEVSAATGTSSIMRAATTLVALVAILAAVVQAVLVEQEPRAPGLPAAAYGSFSP